MPETHALSFEELYRQYAESVYRFSFWLSHDRDLAEEVTAETFVRAEPDRVALMLRARDGLSYEEIATVLGISVAAAKVRIHRARVRLMNVRTLAEETS